MSERDFGGVIEEFFPYDGPHSRDSVADAASGAAALVRYLNNATGPGNGRRTLDRAPTVWRVLGGVHSLVAGLDQLLGQLAAAAQRQAGDPTLYDDRRDRPGSATAGEVAAYLEHGRMWCGRASEAVGSAREVCSHLGHG